MCPQQIQACNLGNDYTGCLAIGKDSCNGIKECLGFSIRKVPGTNDDIAYYFGKDTSCIEANKYEDSNWDFYLSRSGNRIINEKR